MVLTVSQATDADLEVLRQHQDRPELGLVDEHFRQQGTGRIIFAVVRDGERPVGSAVIDFEAGQLTPELRHMYVFTPARRQGAGRLLTRFIEQAARERGYTAVFLAVDPNNYKAVPLYISLEYHPTGEHLFVDEPEVRQVEEGETPSTHYAIYKKSLTAL